MRLDRTTTSSVSIVQQLITLPRIRSALEGNANGIPNVEMTIAKLKGARDRVRRRLGSVTAASHILKVIPGWLD